MNNYNPHIQYSSYGGTVLFKWNRSNFYLIQKILKLTYNQFSNSTTRGYFATYPQPYSCKAIFYQNGRINITSAKSYESLQQTLADCIICPLMQKLPQMEISILEQLSVTNCSAKFQLQHKIDIRRLQSEIFKQYGHESKSNYVYLPSQIHKIEKISVLVTVGYCRISKAHLIGDLKLFIKYINFILIPFRYQKQKYRNQDNHQVMEIEEQWQNIRKQLYDKPKFNNLNKKQRNTKKRQKKNLKDIFQQQEDNKCIFQDQIQ